MRRRARHLPPGARARQSFRQRVASGTRSAHRGARAAAAAGLSRVRLQLLRRDEDRRSPDPHQHPVQACRLRVSPQRFARPGDCRQRSAPATPAGDPAPAAALPARCDRRRQCASGSSGLRRATGSRRAGARGRAHQQRRHRLLAVLLRQHRSTQRLCPPAPRHAGVHRAVRAWRAGHDRARPLLQRGQAVLRLWPGQRALLSVRGRRHDHPVPRPADRAERVRRRQATQADPVLLRANQLRHAPGERSRVRLLLGALGRIGRGGVAAGGVRALPEALRGHDSGWDRLDRDPAHLRVEPARRDPPGLVWQARGGLRDQDPRRGRPASGSRRDRQSVCEG